MFVKTRVGLVESVQADKRSIIGPFLPNVRYPMPRHRPESPQQPRAAMRPARASLLASSMASLCIAQASQKAAP